MSDSALPATIFHKLPIVQARTGLSRSSIYREIKAGHIKTVKIGRSLRFREEDIVQFMNSFN